MITIFTPTYNRGYRLTALYESLCKQTSKNFEWLIVDDGSSDNTAELVASWTQTDFPIRYIKQQNGGKHRAINRGIKEAKGELFFIVDSDDFLTSNAIELALNKYITIKYNEDCAGICGMKIYSDGNRVEGNAIFDDITCSLLEFRYKYGIKGDLAEIYKTKVLKDYPFPEILGEKFCPEAIVWYAIAKRYKLKFFNEGIYVCEYLDDGLTAKILKIRIQSPVGAAMTYNIVNGCSLPLKEKVKSGISFWRFYFHSKLNQRIKSKTSILYSVPGYILYRIDKWKNIK